jgi:hypothetical protein
MAWPHEEHDAMVTFRVRVDIGNLLISIDIMTKTGA